MGILKKVGKVGRAFALGEDDHKKIRKDGNQGPSHRKPVPPSHPKTTSAAIEAPPNPPTVKKISAQTPMAVQVPQYYKNVVIDPENYQKPPSSRITHTRSHDSIREPPEKNQSPPQSPSATPVPDELRQFRSYLQRVSDNYPELKISKTQSLEESVGRLRKAYQECLDEMNDMPQIGSLKKENKDLLKQIEKLNKKVLDEENFSSTVRQDIEKLQDEMTKKEKKHVRELVKVNNDHIMFLTKEREKSQEKVSGLKASNEKLNSDMKTLRRTQEMRVDQARDETNLLWKQFHEKEAASSRLIIDQLHATISSISNDFESQRAVQISSFQQERLDWHEKATKREEELEMLYNEEISKMAIELEDLKGELTRREHIDGMTDPELSEQFQLLANAVYEVSRIQWEKEKVEYWPYTQEVVDRATNPRKLKVATVQSSIWTMLSENIFYTPFQVFADQGATLHHEWTTEFGKDPYALEFSHWPRPSQKSEAWRYHKIKECVQDLERGENATMKIQQRNEHYKKGITVASENISRALERLYILDENRRRAIENLVSQAAKFWLNVGSEHYRILIVMPDSSGNLLHGTKSKHGQIRLVINPKLQRVGNSIGEALDKSEVVGKWHGLIEPYDLWA